MSRCMALRCSMTFLTLFLCSVAHGQRFAATGSVTDSAGTALVQATVVALMRGDSSLVQFTTSRGDGSFVVPRLEAGEYVLQASFVGYQTVLHDFDVRNTDVDVGRLQLPVQVEVLEAFVVTADRLPFVVRGDTIEYNALAFLVRPHDMVEDLLRRLPGIDVDRSGTITAQGETVENVMVEGKEFFGNDPSIATKNLPADAVDKVQVYDKPSDRAELTGVPDGQEEKTINLALTEEAKRGAFGQSTGGLGGAQLNQGRYFARGSVFRFAPRTQLALIGSAENVNQPGFSWGQLGSFGRAGNSYLRSGGIDGYSESLGAGFNANRDLGSKTTVNVSYFLVDEGNTRNGTIQRHQLFGSEVSAFSDESNSRRTSNLAHEVVLNADVNLGEGHDMVLRGSLFKAVSSVGRTGLERAANPSGILQNAAATTLDDEADNLSGTAHLTWRKRITENGRSLIFEATTTARDASEAADLYTEMRLYNLGDLQTREELYQLQELQSRSFKHSQRFELLQPLRSGRTLSAYVQRSATSRRSDKTYFDFVDGHQVLNLVLSDGFSEDYEYLRSGVSFNLRSLDRSWWISGDLEAQHSRRRGTVTGIDQAVTNTYTHVLPTAVGQKQLGGNGSLNLFYRTSTREPSIRQLRPFADNSNPLRTYMGNPSLTPEYRHDLNLQYSLKPSYSGLTLSTDMGTAYTHNSIVRVRTVGSGLRQSVSAINSGATWSADGGFRVGMPIRLLGMEWGIRGRTDLEIDTEFINDLKNESRLLRNSLRLDLDYYFRDLLEVTTSGRITWNNVSYSISDALNQRYVNSRINAEVSWHLYDNWLLETSLHYRILDRDIFDDSQNMALWNLMLSRLLLAGRGNLRLEVNDVLNQNQGVTFTNAATYIQESRIESLGRYVMLKFTYKPKLM